MADIARLVGCSVGALYSRFRDKEALFASAVEVTMSQEVEALRVRAQAGRYMDLSLRDSVDLCVKDFRGFVVGHRAMIRAIYQRSGEQPEYWGIVRGATFDMVQVWIEAISRAAGRADRAFIRQVGIAFQFVSSSLVHAVLIDKQARPLSEREQVFWLDEMVMHFISLDVPEALRGTQVIRHTPVSVPRASPAARIKSDAVSPGRRKTDS